MYYLLYAMQVYFSDIIYFIYFLLSTNMCVAKAWYNLFLGAADQKVLTH